MKTYSGRRESSEPIVTVTTSLPRKGRTRMSTRELSPAKSLKVRNHSPSGFNWGYGGSGPAQLALAILLDLYPERGTEWAERHHQAFKFKVIAGLGDTWTLTQAQIDLVMADIDPDNRTGIDRTAN
jgi:hypothetical protein